MAKGQQQLDPSVFHAFQNGNERAYDYLFRTYFPILCTFIRNYLHQSADSEDLASNCLLKLWQRRDQLQDVSHFENYLFQIARNECNDYLRRTKVRKLYKNKMEAAEDSDDSRFEKSLIQALLIETIFQLAAGLSRDSRQILQLYYFEGLTDSQIAERLDQKRETVKTRRYRAIAYVRRCLSEPPNLFSPP